MTKRIRGLERLSGSTARFVYEIIFYIFSIFYLPLFLMKGKHKGGFGERFGRLPQSISDHLSGYEVIWLHAVSVGEAVQAVRLADRLRDLNPAAKFLFTTTTATGREVVEKLKRQEDVVAYFPVDFRWSVGRFIRTAAPKLVVILETELWPNLMHELTKRSIPVFLVNGRISDKAMPKYRAIRYFIKPLLDQFQAIGVQDESMKARFLELGARPGLVSVTGNMKFDWAPGRSDDEEIKEINALLRSAGSFVWIAGSTHAGEEEMLFDVYQAVKRRFTALVLLIAPRHLDRMESIEKKAGQKGVALIKVSGALRPMPAVYQKQWPQEAVFLLDKMGILAGLYRIADAVFVGGSLVNSGGHNLAEPAFFEKPVLFGPFMDNFKEMADEFRKSDAAIEVKSAKELEEKIIELIEAPQRANPVGLAAKKLVLKHQGATERSARLVYGFQIMEER